MYCSTISGHIATTKGVIPLQLECYLLAHLSWQTFRKSYVLNMQHVILWFMFSLSVNFNALNSLKPLFRKMLFSAQLLLAVKWVEFTVKIQCPFLSIKDGNFTHFCLVFVLLEPRQVGIRHKCTLQNEVPLSWILLRTVLNPSCELAEHSLVTLNPAPKSDWSNLKYLKCIDCETKFIKSNFSVAPLCFIWTEAMTTATLPTKINNESIQFEANPHSVPFNYFI